MTDTGDPQGEARTIDEMAMTPAERKRKQRAEARAKGLCGICAKRKARKGMRTCRPCSKKAAKRTERLRAEAK